MVHGTWPDGLAEGGGGASEKPALSRRERRREERIRAILDTAMQVVGAEGLDALTTHRLARELDVAVGALYRYFPSKGALIAALETEVIGAYGEDLLAATALGEPRAAERGAPVAALFRLLLIASSYERLAVTYPERFRLINMILATPDNILPPEYGLQVMAAMVKVMRIVARRFEEAVATGALATGDAMQRTLLYWSSLRGVLQSAKLERFRPDLVRRDALVEELARALLVGWGAETRDLDEAFGLIRTHREEVER